MLRFMMLISCECCKGSLSLNEVMYEWDGVQLVDLENAVAMFMDLQEAAENDIKVQQEQTKPKLPV